MNWRWKRSDLRLYGTREPPLNHANISRFQSHECCVRQHTKPPRESTVTRFSEAAGIKSTVFSAPYVLKSTVTSLITRDGTFEFRLINGGEVRQPDRQTRFLPTDSYRCISVGLFI